MHGAVQDQEGNRLFLGFYRGTVFDNNDPLQLGRVRCLVPDVLGTVPTDWAPMVTPYGGNSERGMLFIPEKDAGIVVGFESGDEQRPLCFGCWYSAPGGVSEVPSISKGLGDASTKDPFLSQTTPQISSLPSGYAAKYPNNKVIRTQAGHSIELDDTPGKERVRLAHKSGTLFEITENGDMNIRVFGNLGMVIDGDWLVHMAGAFKLEAALLHEFVTGAAERISAKSVRHSNEVQEITPALIRSTNKGM